MAKISLSPRIRKSPYFEATERHGAAAYSVYNKMYLPVGYGDAEKEFNALCNGVTLWDVAVQRIVEISGPDALKFTNMLTPRDLTKCKVGQCKYVLITDQYGGILNDPVLLRIAEDKFWLSRGDSDILMWAKGVAVNSGLNVKIGEPDVAAMQIQGPKSLDVVKSLFGQAAEDLKYYDFMESQIAGNDVILARTGWSAERGYEVYLRGTNEGVKVWDTIMEAGQPFGMIPSVPNRIRRIEAGILDYSVDMDESNNPFEIGLDRLVHLDGDDFIGKEALTKIKTEGVKQKLVGLNVEAPPLAYNEYKWPAQTEDGTSIGALTSVVWSPRLSANIGMAMVDIAYTDLGTEFIIETVEGPRKAIVVEKPFVDPNKKLARA
ncbi:glycine cleavage T C-terminal barrel domain-containing protein [Curvivirga aplysinae]|uniref:glycine cleavage T C-terminal barrel domain-containing protein n=1 Tax=Curvivirga aplysinae TaxID=2529852 RepID=UPI0012BD1D7D|nr:glycine cleavage T C-terminal barrel domain-containing protein [Curvivirga aplysinae]MTI09292.1 glycine cleavage system protein T [Curvivirga aplysinae]